MKKLTDKLSQGQAGKQHEAMNNFRQFSKNSRIQQMQKEQLLKRIFNKMYNNAYSNMSEAFQQLYGKKLAMAAQQKSILPNLLDKILKSRQQQAMEKIKMKSMLTKYKYYLNGLMRWKDSSTKARLYKKKIVHGQQMSGLTQLISNLENIFNKRRNTAFYEIKEKMHSNVFEKLLMRCENRHRERTRSTLDKLVQNALLQRIREAKFQNAMNRVKSASQRKAASSLSQMQNYLM